MKNQYFGIEIELTGLTRKDAARVIAQHFGSTAEFEGGTYNAYSVRDTEGRTWKVVRDNSIEPRKKAGRGIIAANDEYKVEVVSPKCEYKDIEIIQEIVRKLRGEGAIANESCGIHIHIDASKHNAKTLRNLTNIMASKEDLIYKALQVDTNRERQYCKKVEADFLDSINKRKPSSLIDVNRIWYEKYGGDGSRTHYHSSRYHGLNLHSVFQKGTVEFRFYVQETVMWS